MKTTNAGIDLNALGREIAIVQSSPLFNEKLRKLAQRIRDRQTASALKAKPGAQS